MAEQVCQTAVDCDAAGAAQDGGGDQGDIDIEDHGFRHRLLLDCRRNYSGFPR